MRDPGLARSLLGDGISNILSGLCGATANTTYGENIGVMAITRKLLKIERQKSLEFVFVYDSKAQN